ncbi:hypothetical protein [Brucella intermedia]|uniref:hypothetical protein n=1 Tax=Brucella intermedia TaxID=94625 RepID=UPI00224ADFEA|nr:hypothetical protein [Brucella intermedia]
MSATQQIVDTAKIGKKGFPRHFAALGLEPPVKAVPVENGVPQTGHPGLSPIDVYRIEIQAHIDSKAQEKQYDSGATLASYVSSTVPGWFLDAQAFVAWRDSVWLYAFAELDKVQSGERERPSIEDFLAELPVLEWPITGEYE